MNDFFLNLYKLGHPNLKLEPAKRRREWMNENPHVYKCGPVTNCNSFGWDVLTIEDHVIEWSGGSKKEDLIVHQGNTAHSNFGHGVLTFNLGYTWHTPDGWSLYITSIPNEYNDTFWTISALIETDVLKYPFFPSVTLKCPGKFTIQKNTAICRVFPIRLQEIIDCEPKIKKEPQEFNEYRMWQTNERNEFKKTLGTYGTKKGWQKFYHDRANNPVVKMKEVKNEYNDT